MFGNKERRRKEKRKMNFFFLSFVWFAIRKEMKRKYMFFFYFYAHKNVMYKNYGQICNFILYHVIYVDHSFFLNHCPPSNLPKLGGLQICGPGKQSLPFCYLPC